MSCSGVKSLAHSLEVETGAVKKVLNQTVHLLFFSSSTMAFTLRGIPFLAAWPREMGAAQGWGTSSPAPALMDLFCLGFLKHLAMILFYSNKLDILTIRISNVMWRFPTLAFYLIWGLEGVASSCAREDLDWVLGKISLWKGLSNIGMGSPVKWWSHQPQEVFKSHVEVALEVMV